MKKYITTIMFVLITLFFIFAEPDRGFYTRVLEFIILGLLVYNFIESLDCDSPKDELVEMEEMEGIEKPYVCLYNNGKPFKIMFNDEYYTTVVNENNEIVLKAEFENSQYFYDWLLNGANMDGSMKLKKDICIDTVDEFYTEWLNIFPKSIEDLGEDMHEVTLTFDYFKSVNDVERA